MRQVVLYITASVDGFIAEPGGGMGWLDEAASTGSDYGYAEFYASIETMIMGRATYEFVLGAADPFPHADREVFVFTQRDLPVAAPSVTLVSKNPADFTRRLREQKGGPIWLVGGGILNSALSAADLIDEIRLFVSSPSCSGTERLCLRGLTRICRSPWRTRSHGLAGSLNCATVVA